MQILFYNFMSLLLFFLSLFENIWIIQFFVVVFIELGPVQFPSGPTDGPVETSGVIVGASGYGFVPPNSQQSKPWTPQPQRDLKANRSFWLRFKHHVHTQTNTHKHIHVHLNTLHINTKRWIWNKEKSINGIQKSKKKHSYTKTHLYWVKTRKKTMYLAEWLFLLLLIY